VHVDATLDQRLGRWLWLVKWLLVIPHLVVLAFLWIAFTVLTIVAFWAILFTGRYPRSLFEFNVGVLRWTWRVSFYAYGALGSDRYPPFTLADVPDYPAHFDVSYPAQLSRGLVLVKWWLLAIPHYLVVGVFVGGVWSIGNRIDDVARPHGLIALLAVIAGVALLFTGSYPRPIFDFVLGMNRWALRVAAYAGLMTDRYPPFRMDLGDREPAGLGPASASGVGPAPPSGFAPHPASGVGPAPASGLGPAAAPPAPSGWTAGRIVSVVAGSVIGLIALAFLGAGGVTAWATTTQRDAAGYLSTESRSLDTSSYAITSENFRIRGPVGWFAPAHLLGTIRVRATNADPNNAVFIGISPEAPFHRYMDGAPYAVVTGWGMAIDAAPVGGDAAPIGAPTDADVWTAHVSGVGTQSLLWQPGNGSWVLAVMNENGSPGVAVLADIGVSAPALGVIAAALIVAGVLLTALSVVLVAVPVARSSRRTDSGIPIPEGGFT
jgi:hypothetical protein